MMNIEQISSWIKNQVPQPARKLVLSYAMQLAAAHELRTQALRAGVSEGTMKMVEVAGPALGEQLLKIFDA